MVGTDALTLTEQVAAYALGLQYDSIPPEVLDRTKQLFLDFLGVALGGCALWEDGPALRQAVRGLAGPEGGCAVIGEGERYPAHYAALLNAAYAHSMDFDDTHRDSGLHQGTPLFAALLAAGETTGCSGKDFLAAAAAGYEIGGKLGRAHGDRVHRRGFHPTATTGIFAGTAAAGRFLGMDPARLQHALGLDLSFAAGCQQFFETGGGNKALQVGMAAHNALYSLALAQAGFPGTARPLEGRLGYYATFALPGSPLEDIAFEDPPVEVLRAAIKPYPCGRYSHGVIDGVVALTRREKLAAEEIEAIEVSIAPAGYQLVAAGPDLKRRPRTTVDAQFSVYFAAAIAAVDGRYTWESYRKLEDPLVQRLMDRTSASPSEQMKGMGARVAIRSARGTWTLDIPLPRGEPEDPLSWEEVQDKYLGLATRVLGKARAQEVAARVRELEGGRQVSELAGLLRLRGLPLLRQGKVDEQLPDRT